MNEKHKLKDMSLLLGSSEETWNEKEKASFILGLYIFGKNFVQVKRFVGGKKMGDILSFYYGKFYRSVNYQRWSKCRKSRSTKCIYGKKIFTGSRQQELLSRLLSNVSEECCDNLRKVSKAFTEGNMVLEDYVFSLKTSVGLSTLIEAVGVGKENDLTGFNTKSLKPPQMLPVRQEVPVDKRLSKLTFEEIITCLTGKFRRSKARSSALFWEAVWPRLLARGWNSEQPGNQDYAFVSDDSLVFLLPGVKKFSSKLVKGKEYLDSVSDVLRIVACNPKLIELDTAANNGSTNNKDTSPAVEKAKKTRKLKSLPLGVLDPNSFDNEDALQEQIIKSESVNTMYSLLKKTGFPKATECSNGKTAPSDMVGVKNNPSGEHLSVSNVSYADWYATFKEQRMDRLNNIQRKATKCQSNLGVLPDHINSQNPVMKKRRRLTICNQAEKNCNTADDILVAPRMKPEKVNCHDKTLNSSKFFSLESLAWENKTLADLQAVLKKNSSDSLSNGSLIMNKEAVPATSPSTEDLGKKSLQRPMIDLNIPSSQLKDEVDKTFVKEKIETQQNNARKVFGDHSERTISQPVDKCQHQHEMNGRRQSTRNRSMTFKAVEAIAFDNHVKKEKRKSRDQDIDSSMSRPSKRACHKVVSESTGNNELNSQKEDRANGTSNVIGSNNVFMFICCKSQGETT